MLIIATLIFIFYAVLGYKKPGIALVTSPIVCALLAYSAIQMDWPEIVIYAIVIFLITLISVRFSLHRLEYEQWPQRLAKWMLISLGIFALVGISIVLFFAEGAEFSFIIFILFLVVLIALVISHSLRSRYAITACVLSTIGASMRQNLPLPMALEAAASGRRDKRAKTLGKIKRWLIQGYSLSESIKRGYPKCPAYAVAMIASTERIDQLPEAMKALEADMALKADEQKRLKPVHPFYPAVVYSLMIFVLWCVVTFVMPHFGAVLEEIFEGSVLPASTRFLMYLRWDLGPVLLKIFLPAFIITVVVFLKVRFRPRRTENPYLFSKMGDFVKWHLPILRWFEKNYAMLQVVEFLRLSLNAGCTVNDAIAKTLSLDVNNCFRKHLKSWLEKVERGDNIAMAAKESKLGSAITWAFDEKVNPSNAPVILEMLESFYRSNYSYRVNLARFIMWPCIVIAMGVTVGFVIYGIYAPAVYIIYHFVDIVHP